jgi:hypothetical protein
MADQLKLRAQDPADLRVISACLQDALVPVRDMTYLPQERRFIMLLNRFRWEEADLVPLPGDLPESTGDASFDAEGQSRFERVHCALRVERVRAVRSKGLDRGAGDQIVELLAVSAQPRSIDLVFAGGAAIRIEVDAIRCFLEDLGEPWPTYWRPRHPGADQGPPPQ